MSPSHTTSIHSSPTYETVNMSPGQTTNGHLSQAYQQKVLLFLINM